MRKIRRYQSTYSLTTFFAVLYFSGDILMLSTFFFFFFGSVLHYSVTARDTITPGDWLRDDGKTLVSAGKTFELGFFSPNGSSKNGRFVGIWYYMSEPPRIVWVANRDRPLFPLSHTTSGVFAIKEDGKLKVLGKNGSVHWASGIETSSSSAGRVVKLMDSGNLVLSDNRSGEILWESFRNPTDTFLPGMKMDEDLQLTSWLTSVDPASGNYTFELEGGNNNEYIITDKYNSVSSRWKSKEMEGTSEGVKGAILSLLSNFSEASSSADFDGDESLEIPSSPDKNSSLLVMSFSGEIQFYPNPNSSSPSWKAPKDRCSVSKACGKFGSCNINNDFMCKCLPGFVPVLLDSWKNGEFSGGCSRKTPICPKKTGKAVFLTLPMMQVRKPDFYLNRQHGKGSDYCRKKCLSDCLCQAYAETNYTHGRGVITLECLIWNDDLTGLQEESGPGSYDLSVLVAVSDIKPTARNCETCGSNMIPYPLSTGPNCGDPMYSNFECNITTGQVEFKVPGGALRVTSINPGKLRFEVQLKDADCNPRSLNDNIPQLNPPFHMTEACREVRTKDGVVVEISWDPPLEQVCTLSADCKDLQNSTCTTKNETRRCFCNENFEWNSTSLNCVPGGGNPAVSASPANPKSSSSSSPVVLIGITIALALVLGLGITAYLLKRTIAKRKEKREIGRRLCLSESRVKDLIDSEHFKEDDKIGIDVPFFDIEDILVATDNFSNANMLGRGGFGPVYKGKFPEGQEIAVKRLSRASGQGMLEFKNEVVLIAKLQHRNLVRLLGYCIEGDEKILLYEYLPNKSLDSFIFDPTSCKILNWEKRFDIILGIARGLLYLHQDSRLKIIHRDLKTSNILLDDKMNPKISDFGLAKILESKQVEANTNRVVGTYGYMSPEYALDGLFSEKSDVYSYGVMVLEIISGKRNIGFYHSDQILNLLGYAWKLWKEEKVLELMDQTLIETCDTNEFSRCASVGLLCVQEDPSDRPTMRVALMMLNSDTATTMPVPKQPAFVVKRDFSSTASSSSSKPEASGNMVVLTSIGEGR